MAVDQAQSYTRATLLGRLRQDPGDQAAWAEFVGHYGRKVYAWCRAWSLQEADARDVTQTVLLKLAATMRDFRYDPERSFRSWLRTVAQRAWYDFLAARERPGRGSGDSVVLDRLASVEARDDLLRQLDEEFDREVLEAAVGRVRLRVAPQTWEAFRLTAQDGLSGAEAAERIGMQVAQVYVARLVPAVPRNLEAVCLKCLEKDTARRYPTAAELVADLDRFLNGDTVAARTATALERLVEAIGHSEHDRQLRAWGTAVLALAPAMGLPTMAVTGLALWSPPLVWYMPVVGLVVVLVSLATALWLRRHRLHAGVGPAVRQFLAILVGHALAVGAVLAVAPLVFDSGDPLDLLKLGPFVAIVTGQMYYSLGAAYWGRFYLAGVACLGVGVVAALAPVWGPFWLGLLLAVIFTAWGLRLRALGTEGPG
jgi:RNA polymerase sigma-70 factor (ECF subfamily)